MASKPITKIIIKITDLALLNDVWGVFDRIIHEMEKTEKKENGEVWPIVDASGRKQFRAELMKALSADGDPMTVFNRWVTVLVPQYVPVQGALREASVAQGQADVVAAEKVEDEVTARRKAERREAMKRNLAKARAAKTHPPKVKAAVVEEVGDGDDE